MKLITHTARQFANAMRGLLPPGAAWQWPLGGIGDALMLAFSQELVRIELALQLVLDNAINTHKPAVSSWHIDEYRRVANEALNGLTEPMPRKTFAVGSTVGDRLWSANAPNTTFTVPLFKIDHLIGPFRVGSHAGERLWGHRSRYILRVRYYRSVVNPQVLFDALNAFKQAHVFLWFEDITGIGGIESYAQN